ncbi:hypothetical protein [Streptomyces solaniscabiei]|uniref:hypothetical protein n=1 Tax=Streptomyces solaniscabiei TaxID=2683255 RepID=UPI001CE2E420|nr:hypothetical protein [Streptomyces solaniscabiei]
MPLLFPTHTLRHLTTELPHLAPVTERTASALADYRRNGSLPVLTAADDGAREIAAMLHTATESGRHTVWLQIARYATELVALRHARPSGGVEYTPSRGIFGDGIPLERESHQAHNSILSAARHLAYADRYDEPREQERARTHAEQAARLLTDTLRTGQPPVWLAVAAWLTETHAATIRAQQCDSCDDHGTVDICDPSTDALTGSRPCQAPVCARRREEAAARATERHTASCVTGGEEYGVQVCAECRWGGYSPVPGRYMQGRPVYTCTARGCGYTVTTDAFTLDEGERLAVHEGRLYVARPHDEIPF